MRSGELGWIPSPGEPLSFPVQTGIQRIIWKSLGIDHPAARALREDGTAFDLIVQPLPGNYFAVTFNADEVSAVRLFTDEQMPTWISDISADAVATLLYLGHEAIHAIHSEIGVQGTPTSEDFQRWFMHAPARAHYPLRPGITGVIVRYGFIADAFLNPPDPPITGAEFRIEYVSAEGVREVLFSRYLDPVYAEHDRGLQEVELPLTRRTDGKLQLVIDEGRFDQNSGD